MKKNFGTLLVGIVFLIFGGGYVVARLFGYDPPFFFDGWWTLFLMIPALISMVETGLHLGNSIVFVIGLLLLAWEQDWIKNLNFTLILAIVLVREFAVSGMRLVAVEKGRVIAAGWSGKVKTASTMVCICLILLGIPQVLNYVCQGIILVTTVYSGVEYFAKNADVFKEVK